MCFNLSATNASMDGMNFTVYTGVVFGADSSTIRIFIPEVKTYQGCYKRCLIISGGYCFAFRLAMYSEYPLVSSTIFASFLGNSK